MKKFENLGRRLSKEEQKKVKGGYYARCVCIGSDGVWVYTRMPSCYETYEDIATYCRSGVGSCSGSCYNQA